jgi:hypothetical protein
LILFVGTKLHIAMVGRQIILVMYEICSAVRQPCFGPAFIVDGQALSFTTKQASNSSTVHGGGKRRVVTKPVSLL